MLFDHIFSSMKNLYICDRRLLVEYMKKAQKKHRVRRGTRFEGIGNDVLYIIKKIHCFKKVKQCLPNNVSNTSMIG